MYKKSLKMFLKIILVVQKNDVCHPFKLITLKDTNGSFCLLMCTWQDFTNAIYDKLFDIVFVSAGLKL
jgi:hypothetical protein